MTEKQRILKVLEVAREVFTNRSRNISTNKLNETLLPLIEKYSPPMLRGQRVKIKYITQLKLAYPAFAFFSNRPDDIKEPYQRYLENRIREEYAFLGTPIRLFFRARSEERFSQKF